MAAAPSAAKERADALHLLRSVVAYGGVKDVIGDDLYERSRAALDTLAAPVSAAASPAEPRRTGSSPVPAWIVERRRLVAEARTFAGNVEARAVRSPQRIAAYITELAQALEDDCG